MFTRKYLKQLKQLNSNNDLKDKTRRQCKLSEFFFYAEKGWKNQLKHAFKNFCLDFLKDFFIFLSYLFKLIIWVIKGSFKLIKLPFILIKIIYAKYICFKLKDNEEFIKFNDRVKTAEIVDD